MDEFIIRLKHCQSGDSSTLCGVVEESGIAGSRAFESAEELSSIMLNPAHAYWHNETKEKDL